MRWIGFINKSIRFLFADLLVHFGWKRTLSENGRSEQSAGACGQAGVGLALACEGGASDLYQSSLAERFCLGNGAVVRLRGVGALCEVDCGRDSEQSSGAGEFAVLCGVFGGCGVVVSCVWWSGEWACGNGLRGRRLGRATWGIGRKRALWLECVAD